MDFEAGGRWPQEVSLKRADKGEVREVEQHLRRRALMPTGPIVDEELRVDRTLFSIFSGTQDRVKKVVPTREQGGNSGMGFLPRNPCCPVIHLICMGGRGCMTMLDVTG